MDIKNEYNQYCHLISDKETINAEYILWRKKWENHDIKDLPSNVIDALNNCNCELFPNIFELLKVFASIPVTTCTPERTFSTIKRLKNYLRNSTGQERLVGLALMSIHRSCKVNTEEVIAEFSSKKARRLKLLL